MRYVSLFSGVEAATVAWSRLGWQPLAFAEVDPFPCAVLAHRFPDVPNLGDVCNIDWKEFYDQHGAIDVLIGGSPCQSFSIAGNREGLEGESRLMYEYVRAVRDLVRASGGGSPRYIVWENVPGCLSSNKGRDFGCLLDELEECGYFVVWRTLDSQFARVFDRSRGRLRGPVPQRRRRVYLVGSLGGPGAADILIERSCMRGDHPKGRAAREALAEHLEGSSGMGDSAWFCQGNSRGAGSIGFQSEMSPTLRAGCSGTNQVPAIVTNDDTAGFKWYAGARAKGIGYEVGTSPTLAVSDSHCPAVLTPWDVQSKRVNSPNGTSPTLQSGTGEGMNIQQVVLSFVGENGGKTAMGVDEDVSPCMSAKHAPSVISVNTANTKANGSNVSEDGVAYTIDLANSNAVCMQGNIVDRDKGGADGVGVRDDGASYTLTANDVHAVAFAQNVRDEVRVFGGDGQIVGALAAQPGMKQTCYVCVSEDDEGGEPHTICVETGQANATICDDGTSTTISAAHEQPIVIDRAAFNQGGGCALRAPHRADGRDGHPRGERASCGVPSNGGEVIGPLCARDWKGVGTEYVNEGKVVCQRTSC